MYEFAPPRFIVKTIQETGIDLDVAAKTIVKEAYERGSNDNLTIQIVRIDSLPNPSATELYQSLTELPFPPVLDARMQFDGYTILRELHSSSRSHIYLAKDMETQAKSSLKFPLLTCAAIRLIWNVF